MANPECVQQDIVVTAGGTREPIDDVRFVGNFSAGRLGLAIADEMAQMGRRVLCLAPQESIDRFGDSDLVTYDTFTTTASLEDKLLSIESANVVVHSAAVADYAPVREPGKIRSDQAELAVRMQRTQKILAALRHHFGPHSTLIGFKLLSGVEEDELVEVAHKQLRDNDLDMTVANDLQKLGKEQRRVIMVQRQKEVPVEAPNDRVASVLACEIDLLSAKKWLANGRI